MSETANNTMTIEIQHDKKKVFIFFIYLLRDCV